MAGAYLEMDKEFAAQQEALAQKEREEQKKAQSWAGWGINTVWSYLPSMSLSGNPEALALQFTPEVMKELYAAVEDIEDDSDTSQVPREYIKTKINFDLVMGSLALTNSDAYVQAR